MAEQTNVTGLTVSTLVEVDKSDLLAVGLARVEDELTRRMQTAREAGATLAQEAQQKRQEAEALLQADAEGMYRAEVNAAAKALTKFFKTPVVIELRTALSDKTSEGWHDEYRVTMPVAAAQKGQVNVTMTTRSEAAAVPSGVVALLVEAAAKTEASAEQSNLALHWKAQLGQLPRYERRLRANLAETRLAASADGQALLDAMVIDFDSGPLALPAPPART